jgi:hypothetical protein
MTSRPANVTHCGLAGVWSAINYATLALRMMFLQLRMARAHRSVLEASQLLRMSKEKHMLTTTSSDIPNKMIEDAVHKADPEMMTESEDKMKVWGYLMTQYNLKPGLKKFGKKGVTAAVKEITQLHVMDTWMGMDPTKMSQEQQMKALSLLLF